MIWCDSSESPDRREKTTEPPAADKSVAVLLATFNGEKHLPELLGSLCAQNHRDFCVYVRDDGSSDGTLDVLMGYAEQLDMRFLPGGERLGAFQNFFRLLQEADGEHACYMLADQDDCWYPDKITKAWLAIGNRPDDIILYCTRLEYVDAGLKRLGLSRIPRLLSFENAVVENVAAGCTIAVTRGVKRNLVVPDARYSIAHDWWLYMYCSAIGKIIYDERPSLQYRLHSGNTIGATPHRLEEFIRRCRRYIGKKHVFLRQAQQFLLCYGDVLPRQQQDLLRDLIASSNALRGRLRIALRPPYSRQRWIDNQIFRMLFLLGRY